MKLVYKGTKTEVKIGDSVNIRGREVMVEFFRPPHSPASEGKVTVDYTEGQGGSQEFYVSVIGAEWIDREDRATVITEVLPADEQDAIRDILDIASAVDNDNKTALKLLDRAMDVVRARIAEDQE